MFFVHHNCEASGIDENSKFKEFIVGVFESSHFWNLRDEVIKFLPELTPLLQNGI